MFCPQCGTQTGDDDAFCPDCGADLRATAAPPTTAAPAAPPPPLTPPTRPIASSPPPNAAAPMYAGVYPKAPLGRRLVAVIFDSIIAASLLPLALMLVYSSALKTEVSVVGMGLLALAVLWEIAYLLGRDGFGGAGWGKRMTGLVVTSTSGGAPSGLGASIVRQLVLVALGIIPIVGSLIEPVLVVTDKDGRRLGDKAAKTQVARVDDVVATGLASPRGIAGAIVALVIALVLSIGGSAIGGIALANAINETAGGVLGMPTADEPTPGADSSASATTPEQTIDAFYLAVAQEDFDAVVATFSEELAYYADPAMFESWAVPEYRVLGTDETDGTATVDVQEYEGDSSTGVITYTLVYENGAWKIDDWTASGDVDTGETGTSDSGSAPVGALNAETATDAVGTMLNALINDDVDLMRAQATDEFQQDNSSFFYPSGGAFIEFDIVDTYPDVDTWIVVVSEDWNSGPEQVTYIVREQDGRALVDGVIYE